MQLTLKRRPSSIDSTIGELFIDGVFECFTLEDLVREVPGRPVSEWKVARETAIPAGTYAVIITDSMRFKRQLPLLVNVPGFSGVRIHSGNTAEDTEGCILVGSQVNGDAIIESRKAFDALFEKLSDAFESWQTVHITVTNGEQPRS
jgi:hypothetical protein